ncbi:hypothetical protein [Mailhella sp.]|uniref:hypothetical protein n=1 Tax=Mailhella sp. TaxID=1981029 RepID=UPI004062A84F
MAARDFLPYFSATAKKNLGRKIFAEKSLSQNITLIQPEIMAFRAACPIFFLCYRYAFFELRSKLNQAKKFKFTRA